MSRSAELMAGAIQNPARAAAAAATVREPRSGETRGEYLRRMRQEAGLSTRALDLKADKATGTTAHVEGGKRTNIGDDVYRAVATALELDPDSVLALPVQHGPGPAPAAALNKPAGGLDPAVRLLALNWIEPNPDNYRKTFDGVELDQLADSIAANGLLQNLVVRQTGPRSFILVAGERRWRALSRLASNGRWDAGAQIVPARVIEADEGKARALAILENLQRVDVNAMEEAEGFAQLVALEPDRWRPSSIAAEIGCTTRHVQQRLALTTRLHDTAQAALRQGKLTFTQARALTLAAPPAQKDIVKRILDGDSYFARAENLRHYIRSRMVPVDRALFPPEAYDRIVKPADRITESEDGERFFPNQDIFRQLQEEAIAKLLTELKAEGWAWVDRTSNHWEGGFTNSEDKSVAGARVVVDYGWGVTVHRGLAPIQGHARPLTEEEKAAAEAERKRIAEQTEAREKATKAFKAAIQTRLAADLPMLMRLSILEQMKPRYDGLFASRYSYDGCTLPAPLFTGAAAPLAALSGLVKVKSGQAGLPDDTQMGAALGPLVGTDPAKVQAVWCSLVAERINIYSHSLHPVWRAVARQYGIPIPEHYQTDPQSDIEDAANAVRDAEEMADDEEDGED